MGEPAEQLDDIDWRRWKPYGPPCVDEYYRNRLNKYIPFVPTDKQRAFLALNCREAFFGGSAGPGKSSAILMAALQFVDVPKYAAIIIRNTYADLSLPGGLIPKAEEWLTETDAVWKEAKKTWYFPSGATLTFGYLDTAKDIKRYYGPEFQFVGFDEVTFIRESDYRLLFSRTRRPKHDAKLEPSEIDGLTLDQVPIRTRSASNPGGPGHEWVYRRLVSSKTRVKGTAFIPARLEDNPYLDAEEYRLSLENLDPIQRARLLNGDWEIRPPGAMFRREKFRIIERFDRNEKTLRVRYWDAAATEPNSSNPDPDYTAGVLIAYEDKRFRLEDVRRFRLNPAERDKRIAQTASEDGKKVKVRFEKEGGASGKAQIQYWAEMLPGFDVKGIAPGTDKETRAGPFASAVGNGLVDIAFGSWVGPFLDELEAFPNDSLHDDQVDAATGAHYCISDLAGNTPMIKPTGGKSRSAWRE